MIGGVRDSLGPDYPLWMQRATPRFHRARELWALAAEDNDWLLRTAMRPSGSGWGGVVMAPSPSDTPLIDSSHLGLHMT